MLRTAASSSSASRCSWWAVSSSVRAAEAAEPPLVGRQHLDRLGRRRPRPASRGSRAAGRRLPSALVEMFGLIRGSTWSPEKNRPVRSSAKQRWPGVCPGVWTARSGQPGQVGDVAVLEQPVGHGHARERARSSPPGPTSAAASSRAGAQGDEELDLLGDGGRGVPARSEPTIAGVGRVHGDPGAGRLAHPAGQAEVVEVQVGDQHAADVGDAAADRGRARR